MYILTQAYLQCAITHTVYLVVVFLNILFMSLWTTNAKCNDTLRLTYTLLHRTNVLEM